MYQAEMAELYSFDSQEGETISELLARFQAIRKRISTNVKIYSTANTLTTKQFVEILALQILKAAGVKRPLTTPFLKSFGNRLPMTEQELNEM